MAKKAARLLVSLHPTLRDRLRARAAALVERSSFGIERARNSFETSLRELRMDQVDVVLLHECEPQNLQDEALRQLLQEWLRQGLAKSIGIATCHNTIEWALHTQPHEHRVYQFANAPSNPFRSSLLADRTVVTHSALREDLPRIMQSLREETFAKQWSRDLDLDATRDEVAALLLSWAVRRYGGGRVLFSTSRGETIGKTLGRTLALAQDAQRIAAFEKLLAVGR
jgi:hypothetical protein